MTKKASGAITHQFGEVEGARAWFESRGGMRLVFDPNKTLGFVSSFDGKRVTEIIAEDSSDAPYFAFWAEDCHDPLVTLVQADYFESAYEAFCDEKIEPVDLEELAKDMPDIHEKLVNGECIDEHSFNQSGELIYTANVNGCEVRLLSIDFVVSEFEAD